jgi:hypothetical protein
MALTIAAVPVDETEEDEVRAGRATGRDENQVMLDNMTGELADAWRALGADDAHRPTLDTLRTKAGFKRAAKRSVTVAADDLAEVRKMIRRAATLHKVTPIFANNKTNEDGTVRVKWTVGPYTVRVRKAATGNPAPATGAPENPAPAVDPPEAADAAHGNDGTPDTAADAPTGDSPRSWGKRR